MWAKFLLMNQIVPSIKGIGNVFEEPKTGKDKYRSLEIVVVNHKRQHVLGFDDCYF